jgi:hypothetical protein
VPETSTATLADGRSSAKLATSLTHSTVTSPARNRAYSASRVVDGFEKSVRTADR